MTQPYELYHGDCLDVLPTLEAGSVDAVICDPPYGTTACKWDSVIPFEPMWRELKRLIKPRGAIVLFGSQPFTSALVMSWPQGFKYTWEWEKCISGNPLLAEYQPMKVHEDISVFCEGAHNYYPIKRKGPARFKGGGYSKLFDVKLTSTWSDEYFPTSILRFSNADREVEHPTQKPLALLEYLVRTYTNEDDTVLDFTMGSGTTGHACGNLGRRFIGIEKDRGYYEIADERIATAYEPLRAMQAAI